MRRILETDAEAYKVAKFANGEEGKLLINRFASEIDALQKKRIDLIPGSDEDIATYHELKARYLLLDLLYNMQRRAEQLQKPSLV